VIFVRIASRRGIIRYWSFALVSMVDFAGIRVRVVSDCSNRRDTEDIAANGRSDATVRTKWVSIP